MESNLKVESYARFAKRDLDKMSWLAPLVNNRLGDLFNVELRHEQLFFIQDDQVVENIGYSEKGKGGAAKAAGRLLLFVFQQPVPGLGRSPQARGRAHRARARHRSAATKRPGASRFRAARAPHQTRFDLDGSRGGRPWRRRIPSARGCRRYIHGFPWRHLSCGRSFKHCLRVSRKGLAERPLPSFLRASSTSPREYSCCGIVSSPAWPEAGS